MPITSQVHLILGESVQQKLAFREVCTRGECTNRGVKTCPHTLFVDDRPVLEYDEFIGTLSKKKIYSTLLQLTQL